MESGRGRQGQEKDGSCQTNMLRLKQDQTRKLRERERELTQTSHELRHSFHSDDTHETRPESYDDDDTSSMSFYVHVLNRVVRCMIAVGFCNETCSTAFSTGWIGVQGRCQTVIPYWHDCFRLYGMDMEWTSCARCCNLHATDDSCYNTICTH